MFEKDFSPPGLLGRRDFLTRAVAAGLTMSSNLKPGFALQVETESAPPIPEPHFPDRLHLFVWRNWELANSDRMAEVVGTTPDQILDIGASLGLPPKPHLTEDHLRRIYITTIRQNWHVLPPDQLVRLLGWSRERLETTLKEDDMLFIKVGSRRPDNPVLRYQPPSAEARKRSSAIRQELEDVLGDEMRFAGEAPFHFIRDLVSSQHSDQRDTSAEPGPDEIDLNRWAVTSSEDLSVFARELRRYLQESFQWTPADSSSSSRGRLMLRIDPETGLIPDSFRIVAEAGKIDITAPDRIGLRQAVHYLQGLMEERGAAVLPKGIVTRVRRLSPAFLYSYFALFGDPLMEDDIDPFPDEYLKRLSRLGVTGVWLQAILRNLARSEVFPEFGEGAEKRLETLGNLVIRAREHGLKIYLYLNEPRAMPESFFRRYPELKGASEPTEPGHFALCTSQPRVRQWLRESLSQIFSRVPDLGGIFNITMSEHLTNCFSKGKAGTCSRCSKRQGWEVVGEVLQALRDGVREASPDAEVIAWDWGWGDDWVPNGADPQKVIQHMPQDVKLQSVSEWHVPVTRGGFSTRVGEYSISAVGPGPRARRHWVTARQNGLQTTAKVQINATWEISAVPYIPVPHLITRHLDNLLKEGIDGIMLSWTVGGYPSPNLEIAREYLYWPAPEGDEVLYSVAKRRYGGSAAPGVVQAWKQFSDAFEEFPYGVSMYTIPTQHGPANLLRLEDTGYPPGMILFPYDQMQTWVGPYPPEIVRSQFERMSTKWAEGLKTLALALEQALPVKKEKAALDYGIAETCYLHFKSVANQIRFYQLREGLVGGDDSVREEMAKIAREEISLARRLFLISRRDSRIAFEAANHYYYRPLDLAEKILNCHQILRSLDGERA